MTEAEAKGVLSEVLHHVAPEADLSTVDPKDDLREALDLDSFDFLNVLIGLAEKLAIEIPEADYERVRSLSALLAYLVTRTPESRPR
jgi:acyl carrier protein